MFTNRGSVLAQSITIVRLLAFASACDRESSVYPRPGSAICIPVEPGGRRGRAVFMALHRDPEATLHWHLDGRYVGSTSMFHEQALDMGLAWHTLTVVDERGNNARRRFEVLSKGVASGVVSEVVERTP